MGCATSLLPLVSPFLLLRYFPSYSIRAHLEELIYPQLAVDQRSSELEQTDVVYPGLVFLKYLLSVAAIILNVSYLNFSALFYVDLYWDTAVIGQLLC